jgi:hypothetical protein
MNKSDIGCVIIVDKSSGKPEKPVGIITERDGLLRLPCRAYVFYTEVEDIMFQCVSRLRGLVTFWFSPQSIVPEYPDMRTILEIGRILKVTPSDKIILLSIMLSIAVWVLI